MLFMVSRMLKPDKWQAIFDTDGKVFGFQKALKSIVLGELYKDLTKQCQMMHSSVGTGILAYVVGSKVMDIRMSSKDEGRGEAKVKSRQASIDTANKLGNYSVWNNNCTETSYACERESSSDSGELVSVRGSTNSAAYDSSCFLPASGPYNSGSPEREVRLMNHNM
ncbi:hypothetical protein GH714_011654 [Hevea brasiliensis]|uniref:Uncharacterized protein n=1 Tax=Hevea brasiliensis TaxID=3981 RepID=A0A6A6LFT5_HEVBR|nr:hypothetical protein GH714_011654 [Hevea brasiliensis]